MVWAKFLEKPKEKERKRLPPELIDEMQKFIIVPIRAKIYTISKGFPCRNIFIQREWQKFQEAIYPYMALNNQLVTKLAALEKAIYMLNYQTYGLTKWQIFREIQPKLAAAILDFLQFELDHERQIERMEIDYAQSEVDSGISHFLENLINTLRRTTRICRQAVALHQRASTSYHHI